MTDDAPDHHQIVAVRKYNETSKAFEEEKHEPWTFDTADESEILLVNTDHTFEALTGPGILIGGFLNYTGISGDAIIFTVIDGVVGNGETIKGLTQFAITQPGVNILYALLEDDTNERYCMGISPGIRFSTSFAIKVDNQTGDSIGARCSLEANVQTG